MLQETITHICRVCKSRNIVRNGTNRCGTPQYHCKDCGTYRVLQPKITYSEAEKQTILQACQERSSLRGIQRIFGVARQTVAGWVKTHAQNLPEIKDILLAAAPDDVLELDEVWSFVVKKVQKRWLTLRHMMIERGGQSEWTENRNGLLHEPASQAKRSRVFLSKLTAHPLQRSYGEVSRWLGTAMCRRTRQIVAFVIGDRSPRDVLPLVGGDSRWVQTLPYLERLLESVSTGISSMLIVE